MTHLCRDTSSPSVRGQRRGGERDRQTDTGREGQGSRGRFDTHSDLRSRGESKVSSKSPYTARPQPDGIASPCAQRWPWTTFLRVDRTGKGTESCRQELRLNRRRCNDLLVPRPLSELVLSNLLPRLPCSLPLGRTQRRTLTSQGTLRRKGQAFQLHRSSTELFMDEKWTVIKPL